MCIIFLFALNANSVKRNIVDDLDSTRLPDDDISIIVPEAPAAKPKLPPIEQLRESPEAPVVRSPYFEKKKKTEAKERKREQSDEDTTSSRASRSSGTSCGSSENKTSSSLFPEPRPARRVRKPIKISYAESASSEESEHEDYSNDESDDWKGVSASSSDSDSDDVFQPATRGRQTGRRIDSTDEKPEKAVKPKKSQPAIRRPRAKAKKDAEDLIFLDLTHAEVAEVENYQPNVSGKKHCF